MLRHLRPAQSDRCEAAVAQGGVAAFPWVAGGSPAGRVAGLEEGFAVWKEEDEGRCC